jgi:hypothetical protein
MLPTGSPKCKLYHWTLSSSMFLPRRTPPLAPFAGYRRPMLSSHDLWWNGPTWLRRSSTWPRHNPAMPVDETTAKEISTETRKVIVHHVDCTSEWELPQQYSSWTQLVRVTAYILRFIKNSQRKKNSQPKRKLPIEVSELREATHVPNSTENSFFKGVECIEQEQSDSKF